MTLRDRVLLIVFMAVIGMSAFVYGLSQIILQRSFINLERQHVNKGVQQVLNALSQELLSLENNAADWASWDDSYTFIEDKNEGYIKANLVDGSFINLRLNLMLFVNTSGQIAFGKAFDLENKQEIPLPQSLQSYLSADSLLFKHAETGNGVSGLILLPEGPMLMASEPILPNTEKGPAHGRLIMGRYLDSREIKRLSELTQLSLAVHQFNAPDMPADFSSAYLSLSGGAPVFVSALSKDSVAGYALIKDIDGKPGLIVRIDEPRDLYNQGKHTVWFLIASLLAASLVMSLVIMALVSRFILSRMSHAKAIINKIGTKGTFSTRISMAGKDEVSRFSAALDEMLARLEQSRNLLQESKEQYRQLVEKTNEAIIVLQDGVIKFVNSRAVELSGYSQDDLIERLFSDLLHPDDRKIAVERHLTALRGEQLSPISYTYRIVSKGGNILWMETTSARVTWKGKFAMMILLNDITERKRAEEQLLSEKNKLDALVDAMDSGLTIQDKDYNIVYQNRVAKDFYGEHLGEKCYKVYERRDKICDGCPVEEAFKDGKSHTSDRITVKPSGEIAYLENTANPIRDAKGEIVSCLEVSRNITERKQAEVELKLRSELLDSVTDSIFVHDFEGNFIYVNETACKVHGYSREEFMKLKLQDIVALERVSRLESDFHEMLEKGQVIFESLHRRKDGSIMPMEVHGRTIELGGRKQLLTVSRDITERKRVEEAMRASEAQYRLLAEHMSDVVWMMDLDLNATWISPSTVKVRGYSPDEIFALPLDRQLTPKSLGKAMNLFGKWMHLEKEGRTPDPQGAITLELEFICKDGHTVWLECFLRFIRDEQGKATGILAEGRDITERKRVELALRESEERYRALFEQAADSIILRDADTLEMVEFNDRTHKNLGYSREEFAKLPISDLECSYSAEEIAEHIKKVMEKGTHNFETRHRTKSGKVRDIQINARAIRLGGRNLIQGIWRDITERKNAEEALANEAIRRRILVDQSRDGIVVLDENGKVYEVNQRFAEMLGYSLEEARKLYVWDWEFQHPREEVQEMIRTVDEKGDHFETRHRRKDGTTYDVEISTNGAMFSGHKLIFCVCRDITERKRAEEALRRSEEKYRTILEDMQDGYFEVDLAGNITFANDSVCRDLRYSRKELIGLNYRDFTVAEDIEAVYKAFNKVYRTGKPVRGFSWKIVREGAGEGFVEATVFPLRDEEGKIVGFRGIGRDITGRKRAEMQLLMASKLASIGELAAGVAHELNNPLTGVVGYAQLLAARHNVPPDVKADLNRIYYESQRAARIVQNLLSFARQRTPEKSYFNVNELIQRTLDLRSYELRTNNIGICVNLASDLPQIMADYHQIQQVVLNIIINAEQALVESKRRGRITVTTSLVKHNIRISIGDNGPGISNDNIGRIFDPFFTTKEVGKGTGLGLSVCHGIVTAHSGKIYVESQEGKGSTFVVELPAIAGKELVAKKEVVVKKSRQRRRKDIGRILIVDDEAAICNILARTLSDSGYKTDAALDAKAALRKIDENGYELCIIDLNMPKISGKQLYETMKRRRLSLAERVMFITGDTITPATQDFLDSTRKLYLAKPLNPEEVVGLVKETLGGG
jgi:PAS domain S-box-containing protein